MTEKTTSSLVQALNQAAQIKSSAERDIAIAFVIAEALRNIGQDPVLVGGAAVEFYTQGGYSTADIDLVTEGGSDAIALMKELGFEKIGKDFVDTKRKIYIEFPSSSLKPGEKTIQVQKKDQWLKVVSLEDLIVDRLCAFKFWQSEIDGVNTMLLLEEGDLDEGRLLRRARGEDVEDALQLVKMTREEGIRLKLPSKKLTQLLSERMRQLKKA